MSDTIDKRIAIDALNKVRDLVWEVDIPSPTVPEYVEHHEQMKSIMRNIDIITDGIINEPSVQQERVRGKWIRQDNKRKPLYGYLFCSECGAFIAREANFCSECGADMREEPHD